MLKNARANLKKTEKSLEKEQSKVERSTGVERVRARTGSWECVCVCVCVCALLAGRVGSSPG